MKKTNTASDSYLFQVDIMISAPSNGAALEQLLRVLNNGNFEDYRIGSGIRLGTAIEQALGETKNNSAASADKPAATDSLEVRIDHYIKSNKLIRLNINKGRGIKLNIPCRVVNFDSGNQLLTVYHVDEKQVYSVRLNEIDDFIE